MHMANGESCGISSSFLLFDCHERLKYMKKEKEKKPEPVNNQESLHAFYAEAWRQYSHEDNIYQSRNTLYLGVQAALLAIITGVTPALIGLEPLTFGSYKVAIGIMLFGITAIAFSILGISLTYNWEGLTHASRAFLSLRFSTAKIIENQLGMENIGLAGIENQWADWSRENQEQIIKNDAYWFPSGFTERTGKQIEIRPRPKLGGFDAHLGVIKLIRSAWYIIGAAGILCFIITSVILIYALVS